jgi:hypothetical protein
MLTSHILGGFPSEVRAMARSREIALQLGIREDAVVTHVFNAIQVAAEEWALLVPLGQESLLTELERASPNYKPLTWMVQTVRNLVVYRYLPQEFVDAFFTSGRLRISTFSQFAKHADEQRADPQEGSTSIIGMAKGGPTLWASATFGDKSSFALRHCSSARS